MTIEVILIIIGLCLAACYIVFEHQKTATPPYQEPVAPEPVAPEPVAPEANVAQIKDTVEPTEINPQAAWPFPRGPKM